MGGACGTEGGPYTGAGLGLGGATYALGCGGGP